jgi:hypothetical protein
MTETEFSTFREAKMTLDGFLLKWKIVATNDMREGQKLHVFCHMCNIDLKQIQQYYEKQIMLKGGHIREGGR